MVDDYYGGNKGDQELAESPNDTDPGLKRPSRRPPRTTGMLATSHYAMERATTGHANEFGHSVFEGYNTAMLMVASLARQRIPLSDDYSLKKLKEDAKKTGWDFAIELTPAAKVAQFFLDILFEDEKEALNFGVRNKRGNIISDSRTYSEAGIIEKWAKDESDPILNKLEKKGKINEGVHEDFVGALGYIANEFGGGMIAKNLGGGIPPILHKAHAANLGTAIGREINHLIKKHGITNEGVIEGVEVRIPRVYANTGEPIRENEKSLKNRIIGKGDVAYERVKVDIKIGDTNDIATLVNSMFMGEYHIKSPEQKAHVAEVNANFPGKVGEKEAKERAETVKMLFEKAGMSVDDFNKLFQLRDSQTFDPHSMTIKDTEGGGDERKIADFFMTKTPMASARIEIVGMLNKCCKTDSTLNGERLATLAGVAGENKSVNPRTLEVTTSDAKGNATKIDLLTPTEVNDLSKAVKVIAAEQGLAEKNKVYPIDLGGNVIPHGSNKRGNTLAGLVAGKSTDELSKITAKLQESLKTPLDGGSPGADDDSGKSHGDTKDKIPHNKPKPRHR